MSSASAFKSPLRYPGGKAALSKFFTNVIQVNNIEKGIYCEAYAGGAGAALELLFTNAVKKIILNDADYHIYSLWHSILNETPSFIKAIEGVKLNVKEWKKQRLIYENPESYSQFDIGFATFYLNRCNRGGILPNAGPIGGFDQSGNYKIGARFNKEGLIKRINDIADKKKFIEVYNLDAILFVRNIISTLDLKQVLAYFDPPYFQQGKKLYFSFYNESDHQQIEKILASEKKLKWIVSYDNVPEINSIYINYRRFPFDLNYSVQVVRKGKELMVFSNNLLVPQQFIIRNHTTELTYI